MKKSIAAIAACIWSLVPPGTQALSAEIGLLYNQHLQRGYGQRFATSVSSGERGLVYDSQKLKQPALGVGLDVLLTQNIYTDQAIETALIVNCQLRHDYELFDFVYGDPPPGVSSSGLYPGKGLKDQYNMQSIVSRLTFGGRFGFKKVPLSLQLAAGPLFYNPYFMRLKRYNGETVQVFGSQSKAIKLVGALFDFSLNGTAEIAAAVDFRVTYGPIFAAVEYITNWRITALSVQTGIQLRPWKGF